MTLSARFFLKRQQFSHQIGLKEYKTEIKRLSSVPLKGEIKLCVCTLDCDLYFVNGKFLELQCKIEYID